MRKKNIEREEEGFRVYIRERKKDSLNLKQSSSVRRGERKRRERERVRVSVYVCV